MSATDPRPTAEQLEAFKDTAAEAYRDKTTMDDIERYVTDRPQMSFRFAREGAGVNRAVEEIAPALTAHGLEHAAEFLRTRDFAHMDPKVVLFAESLAEEFTARAAALVNGEYDTEGRTA